MAYDLLTRVSMMATDVAYTLKLLTYYILTTKLGVLNKALLKRIPEVEGL